ncbi:FecR family protein [Belliella marina]|uniref:FecR family protein n=1 Tax=Belliella marina TaxID=1644146 RepID=A0ABW4VXE6_9BACT
METPKLKKIISQYLDGKTSAEDSKLIEKWLDNLAGDNPAIHPNLDLAKIKARQKFLNQIEQDSISRTEKKKNNWAWKIAAGLIPFLMLSMAWLYFNQEESWIETSTTFGEFKEFYLPDSSRILLKPNSTIKYLSSFDKNRLVELEGNAFFDVRKNPKSPFLVHSGALEIKVLGTSFDILSFHDSDESKVTVATGLVAVSEGKRQLALLRTSDQLTYNRQTQSFITATSSSFEDLQYKQLVFEDASPKQIAEILSNYYPIEIKCDLDKNIKISATLNSKLAYEAIITALNELLKNHQSTIVKTGENSYRIQ